MASNIGVPDKNDEKSTGHRIHSGPAELRYAFTSKETTDGIVRFCTEPFPDVGGTSQTDFQLQLAANVQQLVALSQSLSAENERLRNELRESEIRRETAEDIAQIASNDSNNTANRRRALSSTSNTYASQKVSGSLSTAMSRAVGIVELKGRSEDVLLARDFLYRICEASMSDPKGYNSDTVKEMQTRAIEFLQVTREAESKVTVAKSQATVVEKAHAIFAAEQKQCADVKTASTTVANLTEQTCLADKTKVKDEDERKATCLAKKREALGNAETKFVECGAANKASLKALLDKAVPAAASSKPSAQVVTYVLELFKACDSTYKAEIQAAGQDQAKLTIAKTNHDTCITMAESKGDKLKGLFEL